jgi:hypothetical protein
MTDAPVADLPAVDTNDAPIEPSEPEVPKDLTAEAKATLSAMHNEDVKVVEVQFLI